MMKTNYVKAIILSASLVISFVANAAGDAAAGKNKALTCAGCHGAEGVSSNPEWPNLAGQVPGYIKGQLEAFKSGERKNQTMNSFAAGLSKQDMADLDAYYSSLKAAERETDYPDIEILELGKKIYKGGIADRNVPSCISCHSTTGQGIPKHFPAVYGQKKEYLENQLLSYKKGERQGYNAIMPNIAFKLAEKEIKALSEYMNSFCAKPTKEQLEKYKKETGDQSQELKVYCESVLVKK